ncbi:SixA phosphatase family protein [Coraliomargarita akajimensis]|uniref:Putative phosphohistidine phosphatase, SixA n=1 Tax=Coraliomargarita akajimensis (strain DSM 45221 / IAM 15411 / JCM 23193 / KCTC 12865 / 04OKA010-24) TaxID=583355 RepID=D5EJZ0_CORAD|nr:histidine phosphatase family protein [Coraliomargarita akajimensis]ADE54739.1 putative phosphohistidine phosphatase, SixA [Coraliomargarita akajimensis DSM 45221]
MKIYLLRHAKSNPGYPDATRDLSDLGRRHVRRLGAFLCQQPRFQPEVLWCSPLTRAEQTAELFEQAWGRSVADRRSVECLEPERDPTSLVERLAEHSSDVLIVGHNPNLEILASILCSGERARSRVRMKAASLLCLAWNPVPSYGQMGPCELEWLLDPRML